MVSLFISAKRPAATAPLSGSAEALDARMMARCVELSREATMAGEYPFACVLCLDGEIVVETTNRVVRDGDLTRHAELIAISQAQKLLGKDKLAACTLYSNVEPCPMCAFAIREAGIARVVFALKSPLMGGHSRWNMLEDGVLSARMPEVFGTAPKVVSGVLAKEAARIWRRWNPIIWGIIRFRGVFGGR